MLIIRFARRGRKGQAFFDLVVAEKSNAVTKKFVEKLGYFNPNTEGGKGELQFDQELVEKYINNGAQVSQSVARLLVKSGCKLAGKFIKARATKPKKEAPKKEEAPIEEPAPDTAAPEADPASVDESAEKTD